MPSEQFAGTKVAGLPLSLFELRKQIIQATSTKVQIEIIWIQNALKIFNIVSALSLLTSSLSQTDWKCVFFNKITFVGSGRSHISLVKQSPSAIEDVTVGLRLVTSFSLFSYLSSGNFKGSSTVVNCIKNVD